MLRTFSPKPVFKLVVAASAFSLAGSALAVEFGPLKLKSSLGEPLHAELELRAQDGDALAPGCIKVFSPAAQPLPHVPGLALSWLAGATGPVLVVRSGQPLVEPAMVFGVEANCGAGRVWQEFPVLLAPLASPARASNGSGWIVAPGESPLSLAQLLYPGQRVVQRRFIRALAEANPGLGIDETGAQGLVAGSSLQMPDWQRLGTQSPSAPAITATGERPPSAKRVQRVSANASVNPSVPGLSLRLARTLQPVQESPEPLRQMLRQEYRLLTSLNEQLSVLMATVPGRQPAQSAQPAELHLQAAPLLGKETAEPATAAAEPLPIPSAPSAPSVPAVSPSALPVAEEKPQPLPPPVKIRQVPAPSPVVPPASGHESEGWLYLAGAGGLVLLLTMLFMRRRRAAAETTTPAFHSPETVVMSHPPPPVAKTSLEAFYAEPAASPQRVAKAVPLPQVPVPTDVNPVMELAEIMLSFGRLDGAAQTLQEYIEANPKEALQPWMKLLEIYRTGGMQAEFDNLARKLNHNFNVEVQRWSNETPPPPVSADEDSQAKALCLEELPHIIEQLLAKWGQPECLDYLHQLLRDNRGGQRSGFALPVVQEILLLIEIMVARQAAENA